jgi:hypothetical protein
MSTPKKFSWKAFVSFYMAASFLVLTLSGLVLYVAPPGRVANWSVWTLIALSKAQWQAVHTVFSLIFVVAGSFHLFFNWKVLVAYVKTKVHDGVRMKRELGFAGSAALLLAALTIAGVPPFSTVMAVGDDLKNAWTVPTNEPPLPHAEELTVEKLAETVKMPADKAWQNLADRGVAAEAGQTIQQIATANSLTPQQVFQKMQSADAKPQASLGGGGWGRKTVDDICRQYLIPVDTGLARLRDAGFDAQATTSLKDLALGAKKTPVEIAKIITGPDAEIATPTSHEAGGAR